MNKKIVSLTTSSLILFQNVLYLPTVYAQDTKELSYANVLSDAQNTNTTSNETQQPGIVTGVKASNRGFDLNNISWDEMKDVDGYEVFGSTSKDGVFTNITNTTQTSYDHIDLKTGITYYYQVRAYKFNDSNIPIYGDFSEIVEATTKFSTPTLTAKSVSYNSIALKWDSVAGADGYIIYRSNKADGEFTELKKITRGSTISHDDKSLKTGQTYYYKIRPYMNGENNELIFSDSYSSIASAKPILASTGAIANPDSPDSIKLTWDKVSGASGYVVYRATSKDGKYSSIKTITSGNTSAFIDSGLTMGKNYYYKVRPYRTVDNSKVYASYSSITNTKPALLPTTLKAVSAGYNSIKLTWGESKGASGYAIYRSTSKDGTYSHVKTIENGKTKTFTDKGLTFNKSYYYKVRPYVIINNKKTYAGYSSVKNAKTALSSTTAKASSGSYNTIKLSWEQVGGATGYEIYRATSKDGQYSHHKTITNGTTKTFTDTKLTMNKYYYYQVRPFRTVDGKKYYGAYSSMVDTRPVLSSTRVKASSNSYNSIKLTWDEVSGASGYEIYRATTKDGEFSYHRTITKGSIDSYIDTNLTTNKTYYYKVRPYRTVNSKKVYAKYSSVAKTSPKLTTPKISKTSVSYQKAKLTWGKVSGANGYEIYRSTIKTGDYTKVSTMTNASTETYTSGKLSKGKTYYFKMRAYRTINGKKVYSSYSSTKTITIK